MYLVTGASGFLGRHLLERLVPHAERAGGRIFVLCRDRASWGREAWTRAYPQVELVGGDVADVAAWAGKLPQKSMRGIFHLAAVVHHSRTQPAINARINVSGARDVVRLGVQLGARTVFVSSSGVVGCSTRAADAPREDAPFCEDMVRRWPYYAQKIDAERKTRQAAPAARQLVVLRPPVLLGPQDHRFRSTGHVVRLLRGRLPFVLSGGFSFVDVRDVADAALAAMLLEEPAPVYHLPGHAYVQRAFFAELARIAGVRPPRGVLPQPVARTLARLDTALHRLGGGRRARLFVDEVVVEMGAAFWNLGTALAAQDLGFVSRPAEETLRDTVAFIRAHRTDCG